MRYIGHSALAIVLVIVLAVLSEYLPSPRPVPGLLYSIRVLGIAVLAFSAIGLFTSIRIRFRRRLYECANCQYSLVGLEPTGCCPECGHESTGELTRRLTTEVRWRRLAVSVCAAAFGGFLWTDLVYESVPISARLAWLRSSPWCNDRDFRDAIIRFKDSPADQLAAWDLLLAHHRSNPQRECHAMWGISPDKFLSDEIRERMFEDLVRVWIEDDNGTLTLRIELSELTSTYCIVAVIATDDVTVRSDSVWQVIDGMYVPESGFSMPPSRRTYSRPLIDPESRVPLDATASVDAPVRLVFFDAYTDLFGVTTMYPEQFDQLSPSTDIKLSWPDKPQWPSPSPIEPSQGG